MTRKFLGRHKCQRCCAKLVRVYDWLPKPVLCAKCRDAVGSEESVAQEHPAKSRREVLGWCDGKLRRRFGDETGVWHLLTAEPAYGLVTNARPVCGTKGMLSGQVHPGECPECEGSGTIPPPFANSFPSPPCHACEGKGTVPGDAKLLRYLYEQRALPATARACRRCLAWKRTGKDTST
jgi:hypothetical protein